MAKILIGTVVKPFGYFQPKEKIYLTSHTWDCDWYWGMGYIGNKDIHTHFNSEFLSNNDYLSEHIESVFTDSEWWVIRDLFKQAYALKECAAVYRHGGHQTTKKGLTDVIQSKTMEDRLNADLKAVLDKVWYYMTKGYEEDRKLLEAVQKA